jgi:hypothetical protein
MQTKRGKRIMDEITKTGQRELSLVEAKKLLDSRIFKDIEKKVLLSNLGETIKKPLEKRLIESKFAQVIKKMPTQELVVLTMMMGFSADALNAVSMYLNAENTTIQRYALKLELENRQTKKSEYQEYREEISTYKEED